MANLELDLREFTQALQEYQRATGKDAATILNRAGRNVCFRAIRYTKSAPIGQIRKHDPNRPGYNGRLFYALAAKEGTHRGEGIGRRAQELYNKRIQSRGYHKAGYVNALKDFGGRSRLQVQPGGRAARGFGQRASEILPVAVITNFAEGSERQIDGLQRAVSETARDMLRFSRTIMQRSASRFSSR